jgi:Lon protease-like protein
MNPRLMAFFYHFIVCFSIANLTSAAFCGNTRERIRTQHSIVRRWASPSSTEDDESAIILLPIFPLRKKVRLPTESLTLNLYEERYLQMAGYILQSQPSPIFGALFAANKPHVVAKFGTGPIVPMIEPGDIGVLCVLVDLDNTGDETNEAEIPTVGGTTRRRIRLEATAAARFQIHRVLHNGFGGSKTMNEDPLPFILVEAKVVVDHSSSNGAALAEQQQTSRGGEQTQYGEWSVERLEQLAFRTVTALSMVSLLSDQMRIELQSFALAAARLPESASNDRLACLLGQDTGSRLEKFSRRG